MAEALWPMEGGKEEDIWDSRTRSCRLFMSSKELDFIRGLREIISHLHLKLLLIEVDCRGWEDY